MYRVDEDNHDESRPIRVEVACGGAVVARGELTQLADQRRLVLPVLAPIGLGAGCQVVLYPGEMRKALHATGRVVRVGAELEVELDHEIVLPVVEETPATVPPEAILIP
ncbi:MAG: hypothetical protein AAF533_17755 [Acidobacteriota bacterium]